MLHSSSASLPSLLSSPSSPPSPLSPLPFLLTLSSLPHRPPLSLHSLYSSSSLSSLTTLPTLSIPSLPTLPPSPSLPHPPSPPSSEAISQVARADATLAVHNDLVEGVVGAELTAAVREVVKACKRERHASLERLGAAVMSLMKGRVLRHWRRQLKERQRVRRAEESFPAWGSTRPLSEQVEALCGVGTGSGPHPPT